MSEPSFPYKWERGRKFGIQSSGTLRDRGIYGYDNDIVEFFEWDNKDYKQGYRYYNYKQQSPSKGKKWKIIENAKAEFTKSNDFNTILMETSYNSYSHKTSINGVDRSSFQPPDPPPEPKFQPSWKTTSRRSRKREKSRNEEYQRLKKQELADGQPIVKVEYCNSDPKFEHREFGW